MQPTTFNSSLSATFVTPTRILVATDLTDGDFLVPHVVAQAEASGARVTLAHAILPANGFPLEAGYVPYPDDEVFDREARLQLQGIARQIEKQGVSCDIYLAHGFAGDVIREEIKMTGATRLIMGSHGRGKWGQLAMGSVANELLGSVDVPVFVVGPNVSPVTEHVTPRRILHPVSLIGDYKKSLEIALNLAKAYKAELTLLHVLDLDADTTLSDVAARSVTWAENAILAALPKSAEMKSTTKVKAVCERLVEGVLREAAESKADWIVLGVDNRFSSLPFSNTAAYQVMARAECCVLAVRHDSRILAIEDDELSVGGDAASLDRCVVGTV